MSAFQFCALLSPLVLGIILPFLFARAGEKEWSVRGRLKAFVGLLLFWTLLLAALWVGSDEPFSRLLSTLGFLGAWSGFVVGLFHLFVGIRLPGVLSQILCSFLVILMVGTLFYFNPILEAAEGGSPETFQSRVDLAMEWNPWVVMAYSIFEDDLLTHRSLYTRTRLADLPRIYPDWSVIALRYLFLAGAMSIFSFLSTLVWRSKREE